MTDIRTASKSELRDRILEYFSSGADELFDAARTVREKIFGRKVYVRGLIELTNYCRNDCYYCGIRASNKNVRRYRLTEREIFECCKTGYSLGFRTFVLQGGEDAHFTDEYLCMIISEIKKSCPEAAVTLSLGERSAGSYKRLFNAGADRYLLRHETADANHYAALHPAALTLKSRKDCLFALKETGFQTGAGYMVGSPHQTAENLAEDLLFLKELNPHMAGIGPFIPHKDTPFAQFRAGGLHQTLVMLALTRIMLPYALLPATTALGSIAENGRELGLNAGANVVMPNLTPPARRPDYSLYNNKLSHGAESAEGLAVLESRLKAAGFIPDMSRGDAKIMNNEG